VITRKSDTLLIGIRKKFPTLRRKLLGEEHGFLQATISGKYRGWLAVIRDLTQCRKNDSCIIRTYVLYF